MRLMHLRWSMALITAASFGWLPPLFAQQPLPDEVTEFIEQRTLCEHFRAEPWSEGNTSEELERREFLIEQSQRYCTGSDDTPGNSGTVIAPDRRY